MHNKKAIKIRTALISVYHKDRLDAVVRLLDGLGVTIYSTGGTLDFITGELSVAARSVESLTGYPSVFGGRVKTLHPKVFGGILARRGHSRDVAELAEYDIPPVDLVVVDLYPFEEMLKQTSDEQEIIEKIDIGGISLIRAAAKNFEDVLVISSRGQYGELIALLEQGKGETTPAERRRFAAAAFLQSSHYDTAIFNYFNRQALLPAFRAACDGQQVLRYGENPHQPGVFYGALGEAVKQLHGKEISYNNLLDIDAAIALIGDFTEQTYAVLKHNNACGCATDASSALAAWQKALAGDPVSAFGGVIITNRGVDRECAEAINELFFEVIIAPKYAPEALEILQTKKNRIILEQVIPELPPVQFRTLLNGVVQQHRDTGIALEKFTPVTEKQPTAAEVVDLAFANRLVKHSKSNAIVLAGGGQLLASGVGQTSRVDALKQAIDKAHAFGFSLQGAVMASDAFFPFPDCVELAHKAGITAVVQPGGSINDQKSIDYCNCHGMAMVTTGVRHFKH